MIEMVDLQDEIAENQSNKTLQRKGRKKLGWPLGMPKHKKKLAMLLRQIHKIVDRELAVMSELVRLGFYQVVSSGRFLDACDDFRDKYAAHTWQYRSFVLLSEASRSQSRKSRRTYV